MDFFSNGKGNTTKYNGLTPVSREVTNKESGKMETKWYYAGNSGKVAIKQLYDRAEPFNEHGLALVRLDQDTNERYGFIDSIGREVVPIIYDLLFRFNDLGFANAKRNGKWGYVNQKGEEVIPLEYSMTEFFKNDLVKVCQNNKWGYINYRNEVVVPIKYDWVWSFSEGIVIVRIGEKHGAVNLDGEEITLLNYECMKPFHSGMSATKQLGKWGYLDCFGNVKIPFAFDDAWNFEFDRAQVKVDSEFYFIDAEGKKL